MRKGVEKKPTLCWDCANACGGCSWSDHWKHEPVPGWTAEETVLKINSGLLIQSYSVRECPEFKPDRRIWNGP